MKLQIRKTMSVIFGAALILSYGCGDDASKKIDDDDDDSETDENTDNDNTDNDDPDGGEDDTSAPSEACGEFHDFLVDCGMSSLAVMYVDGFCSAFDDIFIDSYMDALVPCMSEVGCDGFLSLITSTDTDAGDSDGASVMEQCAATALTAAEPEQANLDFQEHFCDYATQCDAELSQSECEAAFLSDADMLIFMVLDEPYISDADACVYPMPACSEDVVTCIEEVGNTIGDLLSALDQS